MAELRDIGERLVDFGAAIIKLLHRLPPSSIGKKIEDQMVRSAMSSGANYEEARGAGSRADFCNKLQISLKEMRETRYWLVLTEKAGLIEGDSITGLVNVVPTFRIQMFFEPVDSRFRLSDILAGCGCWCSRIAQLVF